MKNGQAHEELVLCTKNHVLRAVVQDETLHETMKRYMKQRNKKHASYEHIRSIKVTAGVTQTRHPPVLRINQACQTSLFFVWKRNSKKQHGQGVFSSVLFFFFFPSIFVFDTAIIFFRVFLMYT